MAFSTDMISLCSCFRPWTPLPSLQRPQDGGGYWKGLPFWVFPGVYGLQVLVVPSSISPCQSTSILTFDCSQKSISISWIHCDWANGFLDRLSLYSPGPLSRIIRRILFLVDSLPVFMCILNGLLLLNHSIICELILGKGGLDLTDLSHC